MGGRNPFESPIDGRHPPLRIDILNKALGIDFEKCYKRKKTVKFDGIPVKVLSKPDLIKSKLAAHRPKDLADGLN